VRPPNPTTPENCLHAKARWPHMTAFAPFPSIVVASLGLFGGIACALAGSQLYTPFLSSVREPLLPALLALSAVLAVVFRPRGQRGGERPPPLLGWLRTAAFAAAVISFGVTSMAEARFRSIRNEVLTAPAEDLARIGRHIMVGIDEPYELKQLIEARAIAGIFVTRRNAAGKSSKQFAEIIAKLDAQHRSLGGPGLWVSADQEGGIVQRLSPPLPRQTSLPKIVRQNKDPVTREAAVRAFAQAQGKALAGVGVNVNFAPVVDIGMGRKRRHDGATRLAYRAISDDPTVVAETARWYCEGLWAAGVRCTRKHFPGLGRVFTDTHAREATLAGPLDTLVKSDWVPFEVAGAPRPDWVMVGHMRVEALDPLRPASASPIVISRLRDLGHTGIVITDDFSMGAIQKSRLGVGGAAVEALNAGVDILLISYDADQIYLALHALLQAHREGILDREKLRLSEERLDLARQTRAP
jgi:beta-N-acetylhexosaminidase